LQWWVVCLPSVIIIGNVAAGMYGLGAAGQAAYMQKLFIVTGLATVAQVLAGHRLPLVLGPAAVLLVGMTCADAPSPEAVYTAMAVSGALVSLAALCGLLSRLRLFFTPRIVAVVLMLIAVSLAPSILRLSFADGAPPASSAFVLLVVLFLLGCNRFFCEAAKPLIVCIGLAGGGFAHVLLFGGVSAPIVLPASLPLFIRPEAHIPTILSFLFCSIALLVNELSSIEAIGRMIGAEDMEQRTRRGVALQGAANVAAGSLGVIGSVDYTMSAGIIAATGCASRYTLLPAGAGLALCGLFPSLVRLFASIPGPVMGALLLYLMTAQLASGLTLLSAGKCLEEFAGGCVVALPLMIGILVSFAPPAAFAGMPEWLRPIAGNGFVMGVAAVVVLEHWLCRPEAG
jgi:xanthine/uracil permease